MHEIYAHLRKRLNGIASNEAREHSLFYNYKHNPDLLKRFPSLNGGHQSPRYKDVPTNSQAGKIKTAIESSSCDDENCE
jgi:hypothetical protein